MPSLMTSIVSKESIALFSHKTLKTKRRKTEPQCIYAAFNKATDIKHEKE